MFPEVLLAVALMLIGVLLILSRRQFPRLMRAGLTKFFGPGVAEDATRPGVTTSLVVVGIGAIAFGVFNVIELFVGIS
ncbi:hypothetical protein [Microbacterium aerolatum]|uniref:hypothetical protein n=1 Tax=Microbacterium aerolatum TaxID=153731 RepID=UPI0011BEE4FE|nr:hypothetical protein [Microbacterium aerolatum]